MCSLPRNICYIHVPFYNHLHSSCQIHYCICSLLTFYLLWTTPCWYLNSSLWFISSLHGGKKPPSGIFMIFMRILHSWNPWHLKAAFCYLGSNSSDGLHPALLGSMFVPCLREMLEGHSTLFFPGFLSLANQSSCPSLGTGWSCEVDVLMSPSSQGVWAHWFNSVSVSWVPTVCQMLWEPLEVKRIKGDKISALRNIFWGCVLEWREKVYNALTSVKMIGKIS